ncbi:peptide deformylase [Salicola sp. Rm-C-2C1-2]|uniref:peptide deformylase n=1 Tax=Salicola sp. Rm-C-2C1-2 TaxID=3141321 RepID=UPI0032E4A9E3
MTLSILEFPDPRLRTVAEPVESVDDNVRALVDNMIKTMYGAPGIGLAATQVNVHQRVLVIDLSEEQSDPRVFINPELEIPESEKEPMQEGCLSIPGVYEDVTRSQSVRVRALDYHGEPFEQAHTGLMAVCLQHEVDHLNGRLFIDYLSQLKRSRIRRRVEKQQRQKAS